MVKILQARLQLYVNCELLDVQAGFRKGRETRIQISNINWIIKKSKRILEKTSTSALLITPKPLTIDHNKLESSERDGNTRPHDLPPKKSVCRSGSNT